MAGTISEGFAQWAAVGLPVAGLLLAAAWLVLTRIARTVIDTPGQPPIGFALDDDRVALDPRGIYTLRGTIRRGGQLMFTPDTITRVLQWGDPADVEVILKMVPQD
ncbi:YbaY family lipoprotein [Rhodovulum euryhalinum]|uniref:Type III secretion system (T3SS) chaperone YscW n=1 Tax=Rhodovulum euryhalinum TaxID=35805 RepID=A0A4R2KDP0_9RHOB|nr:YbaY family lipoprotein [Rhodovulum euryhalinum]TCO70277.1 type III secretion system (T3SS) chaperone YscW [Rhodovulum euryhalinum]